MFTIEYEQIFVLILLTCTFLHRNTNRESILVLFPLLQITNGVPFCRQKVKLKFGHNTKSNFHILKPI